MKFKVFCQVCVMALMVCPAMKPAFAQLPAGLPGGLSGGAGGSASGAAAVDRVQAQVQQRVRAQVQQRLQTQVQSRIQVEARRAAQIAHRAAAQANRRAEAVANRAPNRAELRISAAANANARSNGPTNGVQIGTRTSASMGAAASLPVGVTDADVEIYDNIFGRFNPLRQPSDSGDADGPAADSPANDSRSNDGETVTENDDAETESNEHSASNRRPRGLLSSCLDAETVIRVAARQRRAEISRIRDSALETSNAQLLSRADEMERRLDAFVAAQAEIRMNIQSDAHAELDTVPSEGQTHAAATGNVQGKVELQPRTAQRQDSESGTENTNR